MITEGPRSTVVLMAEDDEEDRMMARDALAEAAANVELRCVENGEELLDYLRKRGRWAGSDAPMPGLILLDLNMPRKDGREALREMKADPLLRRLPVIVLTTSREEDEVARSYDLGANSFVRKPVSFDGLVAVMRTIGVYWFDTVELPRRQRKA
jgi:CheY-like chemotaxis protein